MIDNIKDNYDAENYIQAFGAEEFQNEVIKASETYTSFYMRYLKKDYNLRLEGDRIQYIENVLKQLAMIESPVEREYYLKELSDEYDISLDTLKNEIHVNQQKMTPPEDKRKKSR